MNQDDYFMQFNIFTMYSQLNNIYNMFNYLLAYGLVYF